MKRSETEIPEALMTGMRTVTPAGGSRCKRSGCAAPLPRQESGRSRQFCSDECRRRHYNALRGTPPAVLPAPADGPGPALARLGQLLAEAGRLAAQATGQVADAAPPRAAATVAEAEASRPRAEAPAAPADALAAASAEAAGTARAAPSPRAPAPPAPARPARGPTTGAALAAPGGPAPAGGPAGGPRKTRTRKETTPTTPTAANDAAAACQRLRGHLASLKLNAAIEALPSVLDAARDGQLTVLDAIEQLMGTEAAAADARKLASRLHWAALPAPWRIEDYDFSAHPGADDTLIRALASLRFIGDSANIIFIGPPATGKTILSVAPAPAPAAAGPKVPLPPLDDLTRPLPP